MIAMTFQMLLLQKPVDPKASPQSHSKRLEHRLDLWRQGDIDDLLHEARTIQEQLSDRASTTRQKTKPNEDRARQFASMVHDGKVKSALRLLSEDSSGGVLHLEDRIGDNSVLDLLRYKHPVAEPLHDDAVITGDPPPQPHPVLFHCLNRDAVRRAALHTHGAAGPSGVDADGWRRMTTAFSGASDELCDSLANCARRIATAYVDPEALEAFTAARLIPLDKKPGVRPIGIGETVRRILGKAILAVTGDLVQSAAGSLQLCAGQPSGIEAAIHAMHDTFHNPDVDGVLLADASNAFNR